MTRSTRVALVLLLALLPGVSSRAANVDFVHVAANSGGASGGHSALRLGDDVYHYQSHGDGLLRLDRVAWADFDYRYGSLGNRELGVARVPVSEAAFRSVKRRLARLRVVQRRHLDRLSALELEARWFEARGGGAVRVGLPGAGLFDPSSRDEPAARALRAALVERWGQDFLERSLEASERELSAHAAQASSLVGAQLGVDTYPAPAEIWAERLRDQLQLREALRALSAARSLAEGALLDLAEVDADDPDLSPEERARLERLAERVRASVVRLAGAERPGRGLALMVAAARYQALQRSLAQGRLRVLDTLSPDAASVPVRTVARNRDVIREQAKLQRALYRDARRTLASSEPDEAVYRRLEDTASRYHAIQSGAALGRAIRISAEPVLIPVPPGPVRLSAAVSSPALVKQARANVSLQRASLERLYSYQLFNHNCATELVRALYSAFADDETAARELGGVLKPGFGLAFVPAALGVQVERKLAVADKQRRPSYRQRRLAEMAEVEPPQLVRLRESNTWTSSVYSGADGDGAFLFFTDGAPLLRPVLGALNLGYAAGHTAAGLLTAPWDRGRRLVEALHGVAFSLPELFFVNIRKGSYEFVPREGLHE